jgi:hypothetical protein
MTPAAGRNEEPLSVRPSPQNRFAAAMRVLIDVSVGRLVDDEALTRAAEVLEGLAPVLEAAAAPGRRPRGHPIAEGHPQDYFWTSPMAGHANPLSVPVRYWADTDDDGHPMIRGLANIPLAYEGPPTCVHGGVVALLFDELLGNANIISGHPGMTGTLSVRYEKPTPLLTDLDLAATFIAQEGRKITTVATISHGGVVTARAEGLFIEVPPNQMLGIVASNASVVGAAVLDDELASYVDGRADNGLKENDALG